MELEHKYQMQEIKQKELKMELTMLQEQKQLAISSGVHNSGKI